MRPLLTRVVSAHVMGGCAMSGAEARGRGPADGVHWQLENLSVHDGSVFPTSIGANPQLSVYGMANRLASGLATRLGGRDVALGDAARLRKQATTLGLLLAAVAWAWLYWTQGRPTRLAGAGRS